MYRHSFATKSPDFLLPSLITHPDFNTIIATRRQAFTLFIWVCNCRRRLTQIESRFEWGYVFHESINAKVWKLAVLEIWRWVGRKFTGRKGVEKECIWSSNHADLYKYCQKPVWCIRIAFHYSSIFGWRKAQIFLLGGIPNVKPKSSSQLLGVKVWKRWRGYNLSSIVETILNDLCEL